MRPATYESLSADLDLAVERGDTDEAIRLADQIDRMEPPRFSLALSALWYAQHGLWVFPLLPLCKIPWPHSHGLDDATRDPDRIHQWWERDPYSNIGIATGHLYDVIDFDGPKAHARWGQEYPTWADADVVVSGSVSTPRLGGLHVYVAATGAGNVADLFGDGTGVDYRGLGGYVVAPPSVLDDRTGQVAGTYRWLRPIIFSPDDLDHG